MPDHSSNETPAPGSTAQESSYASLPAMEATQNTPKTPKRKNRQRWFLLLVLPSIAGIGVIIWVIVHFMECESCWPTDSIEPSKRHLSILAPRAPPYQDSCVRNDDCDWGYKCIENTCYHGCDENRDCLKPQYCGAWYFPSKYGADFCLVNDFRVCKPHLDFCRSNDDCCSGNCQRKNVFWRMCQPSAGRARAVEENS